jgi:hypothetical protein
MSRNGRIPSLDYRKLILKDGPMFAHRLFSYSDLDFQVKV